MLFLWKIRSLIFGRSVATNFVAFYPCGLCETYLKFGVYLHQLSLQPIEQYHNYLRYSLAVIVDGVFDYLVTGYDTDFITNLNSCQVPIKIRLKKKKAAYISFIIGIRSSCFLLLNHYLANGST